MINLIDGYKIQVLPNCYAIGQDHEEIKKKTGESKQVFKPVGYYSTFRKALKNAHRHLRHDALESFDGDLKEAMAVIRDLDARFEALLEDIDF